MTNNPATGFLFFVSISTSKSEDCDIWGSCKNRKESLKIRLFSRFREAFFLCFSVRSGKPCPGPGLFAEKKLVFQTWLQDRASTPSTPPSAGCFWTKRNCSPLFCALSMRKMEKNVKKNAPEVFFLSKLGRRLVRSRIL